MIPLIGAASQEMLADGLYLASSTFMSAILNGVLVSFGSACMPARQGRKLNVLDALARG